MPVGILLYALCVCLYLTFSLSVYLSMDTKVFPWLLWIMLPGTLECSNFWFLIDKLTSLLNFVKILNIYFIQTLNILNSLLKLSKDIQRNFFPIYNLENTRYVSGFQSVVKREALLIPLPEIARLLGIWSLNFQSELKIEWKIERLKG